MTDEEIVEGWKARHKVKKPDNLKMYDGRYNAGVLFEWLKELTLSMTPEERAAMWRLANEPQRRESTP